MIPPRTAWVPDWALIRTRFLELRRHRPLVIAMIGGNLGILLIMITAISVMHAVQPDVAPAGGGSRFTSFVFLMLATGVITAMFLGAIVGSEDLSSKFFRALVTTGRSRLALYLARLPAGLALLAAVIIPTYAVAVGCAVTLLPSRSFEYYYAFSSSTKAPGIHVILAAGGWLLLQLIVVYAITLAISALVGSEAPAVMIATLLVLADLVLTTVMHSHVLWSWLRFVDIEWILWGMRPHFPGIATCCGTLTGLSFSMPGWEQLLALVVWLVVPLGLGAYRSITRDA
ncbi:MAG: hypothetical protein M0008_14575 [Actinomycetota bacterium]|nr:hypothetical protein [Actinomycetota bacterium]